MPGLPDHPECDFAVRPELCHAAAGPHPRFCHHIRNGSCAHRSYVWRATTPEPAPFDCPADEPGPPPVSAPPQPPPVVVHTQTPTVPLAVSLAVVNCPSRGAPIECGCAAERRYCGETLDVMTWDGCVACKAAQADAIPSATPESPP